jgi:FkbM family methyltransferase
MPLCLVMKQILRSFISLTGFELLHSTEDPVLQSLLSTYNELRLNPNASQRWSLLLPNLSSLFHLRQALCVEKIDLLLDVGANRGQFALDARRAGYKGEIISFEPLSTHHEHLNMLALRDKKWTIFPYALGSQPSELTLNVYKDDSFSSFHQVNEDAKRAFGDMVELDHLEAVKVCTIDQIAQEIGLTPDRKIFIKTDTQGHDAEVLRGGCQTLKYVCGVLTEATVASLYDSSSTFDELLALLLPMGFVMGGVFPISYTPGTVALIEMDCFFTRLVR